MFLIPRGTRASYITQWRYRLSVVLKWLQLAVLFFLFLFFSFSCAGPLSLTHLLNSLNHSNHTNWTRNGNETQRNETNYFYDYESTKYENDIMYPFACLLTVYGVCLHAHTHIYTYTDHGGEGGRMEIHRRLLVCSMDWISGYIYIYIYVCMILPLDWEAVSHGPRWRGEGKMA